MTWRPSFGIMIAVLISSCGLPRVDRELTPPDAFRALSKPKVDELKNQSPFLKAHLKDGSLYIFSSWEYARAGSTISGTAHKYDPGRRAGPSKNYSMSLDSVALIETNILSTSGPAIALTVFTGITAAVTVFCITNPKACFGSCPTFYVLDGNDPQLDAEGFSSSISPFLESTDLDGLPHASGKDGELTLQMKNEALETHIVRRADILAVPRKQGCGVFKDLHGHFWESPRQISPALALGPEGNCLPALSRADGRERSSRSDETDLAAKETIDLQFHLDPKSSYGLILSCRQSLLPTYLLYQTLAYMGNDAGFWLARPDIRSYGEPMEKLLGGIEVAVRDAHSGWRSIGSVNEHGPLARDSHLLPLGNSTDTTLAVRLTMAKGMWRIDHAALAELSQSLEPVRLQPRSVLKDGREDSDALARLLDPSQTLVTFPGDVYTLTYALSQKQAEYEFFLESRGYYLEWMRAEWIQEQNPQLLSEMFLSPAAALKRLAPDFKRVEPGMEDCFWRSRYAKQ